MSDALPLPARPNLEQYKKLAKDFRDACRGGADAIRAWAAAWLERRGGADPGDVDRIQREWQALVRKKPGLARCTLADAQFFVARFHGFASWPAFASHVDDLQRESSGTALFESAADAIVGGDAATLERLLRAHPELARARSTRGHRATLLHYVAANGIEDFRQKTPKNIVEIARMLLDAGADVNAGADAYGPRDETLMLAATSCHPHDAGVQIPLLALLLERGARIDGADGTSTVVACLHNGRGPAADYLAARGARLDLEGAAGVGRLDVVQKYFDAGGKLTGGATEKQMRDGFAWACANGKTNVVDFLLDRGAAIGAHLADEGPPLHWAAYGGHADTVRLLIARGARATEIEHTHEGTPLDWALYGWANRTLSEGEGDGYYDVVAQLTAAGARFDPGWVGDDPERARAARKLRADPRMMAALERR